MIKQHAGFTLLELLMAAVLVAVLAMFATMAFRQSASDIRVQDAKNRASVVAMAIQRFLVDHPQAKLYGGTIANPNRVANEALCVTEAAILTNGSLQNLVDCGYLEYRHYLDSNFTFVVKNRGPGESVPELPICMFGTSSKIAAKYRGQGAVLNNHSGYLYCTDGDVDSETF